MAVIPLGTDDVESKDENAARIRLENMYLVDSPLSPDGISRVSRPTLDPVLTFDDGPVYGCYREDGVFEGFWFIVTGTSLYSYDPLMKIKTLIGSVPGTGFCEFAGGTLSNGSRILILRDGIVYSWNGSVLNTVNVPDNNLVGSVTYIDSYYILSITGNTAENGRFYWISPGLTDPDSLDFATAERMPDNLVSVSVVGDELWLIGESSVEIWTASSSADAPFQRIPGRAYTYGCLNNSTTVETNYNGQPCLFWVTDTRIVVMGQGTPTRVSNDSVDELLRGSTNHRAWGFEYNRHNFYVLTCDEVTLVYDLAKSTWARWSSFMEDNWKAHLGFQDGDHVYAGDWTNGVVYELVEGTDDNGDPVVRTVSGLIVFAGNYQNCSRVNVIMNAGWSPDYTGSAMLEMRWSDDLGQSYTDYFQTSIGDKGYYRTDVSFSGLGMIRRPGRLFQFRFSDKARFRLDYATMNEM